MDSCDYLFINATTIDMQGKELKNQAIAVKAGRIIWCGSYENLPPDYQKHARALKDCQGNLLTPGLIDCHSHLVFAGNRATEFQLRLEGKTYSEIANAGGGIFSTVQITRMVSEEELLNQSLPRILALRKEGVTTVEIKSGYGLDLDTELKMLRVARRLGELSGVRVQTTFLGAHALPPEYKSSSQAYVDFLCAEVLPAVVESGLADAVDVFCESIAFNLQQSEQLFQKAKDLGLPIKCHAEQLSNMGASQLAAKMKALSCDHLEHLDKTGAEAMALNGTVAVLLPGAFYFLKETTKPPVALLREMGIGIAVATDSNPGSSPTTSLLLMMNMACQLFGLTISEALTAVTYQAVRALGLEKETGSIAVGLAADLVLWSLADSASLCYYFGYPIEHSTMRAGRWLDPN
ncbi:MAG: imidazolonepropionase [Tatlockia sp.]|nr:imidazolonepropionase [Tatlockia sp.]